MRWGRPTEQGDSRLTRVPSAILPAVPSSHQPCVSGTGNGGHSAPPSSPRRLTAFAHQAPLTYTVIRTAAHAPSGWHCIAPLADARLGIQGGVALRRTFKVTLSPLLQGSR